MRDKFQKAGVPHYAPMDSPRPVPPEHAGCAPLPPVEQVRLLDRREQEMSLRQRIDEKWKPGDCFICRFPEKQKDWYPQLDNRRGKFVVARWRRDDSVEVVVEWVEAAKIPENHRNWRMRNQRTLNAEIFLGFAQHCEESK